VDHARPSCWSASHDFRAQLDRGDFTATSSCLLSRKRELNGLGYQAFRRGLATNLRALSVDDLTIMEILRHSDGAVTRASYIKRVSDKSVEGMDRLAAEIAKPTKITHPEGKPAKNVDVVLPASVA
jgi:integrase